MKDKIEDKSKYSKNNKREISNPNKAHKNENMTNQIDSKPKKICRKEASKKRINQKHNKQAEKNYQILK